MVPLKSTFGKAASVAHADLGPVSTHLIKSVLSIKIDHAVKAIRLMHLEKAVVINLRS
jgi:hypothetical protein